MFALTRTGIAELRRSRRRLRGIVDHQRARRRKPERLQQVELRRLREFQRIRRRSVHHRNAQPLDVPEEVLRVERRRRVPADVRRRRGAIDHERVRRLPLEGVEGVRRGVEAHVRRPATLELGEERAEPVGVLVEDGDRKRRAVGRTWRRLLRGGRRGTNGTEGCNAKRPAFSRGRGRAASVPASPVDQSRDMRAPSPDRSPKGGRQGQQQDIVSARRGRMADGQQGSQQRKRPGRQAAGRIAF